MNSRFPPWKRRGYHPRGRGKKGDDAFINLPLVAQGIPHLSASFIQKNNQSIRSEATDKACSFESSQLTHVPKEDSSFSEGFQEVQMALKPEYKNPNNIPQDDRSVGMQIESNSDDKWVNSENSLPAADLTMVGRKCEAQNIPDVSSFHEAVPINGNNHENKIADWQTKEEKIHQINEQMKSDYSHPTFNPLEMFGPSKEAMDRKENIPSEREMPQKKTNIEFISVYSAEEPRKKLQETKLSKDQELRKEQSVPIGPLQPVLESVDSAQQLDTELEKYQKEVNYMNQVPKPIKNKPKCLTAGEIARISREYALDKEHGENSEQVQTAWDRMHQYWTFVQENPYDFDGWTYLLNHVETMDNIEAARSAYEGFLPLYPYCFAYWMKLSDLELKFSSLEQALGVLHLGTKCVPFCTDLWVPLLNKFLDYAQQENISEDVIRGLYEIALNSLGLSWQSSSIWDICINYELTKGDLLRVMNLYRRVLSVPTKLYNRHWDNLLALVRDYHPRNLLTIEEYSNLKKSTCDLLKIKFNPPSLEAPKTLIKVTQPEDKIHTTIKEKIVASLIPIHEVNEKECNKRWKYEEKIKRPYFHVKPLEKKQLKTWREYIDFEMKEGDPVRVVSLFERCLVPCAMYEEFWCNYASFMEDHVLNVMKGKYSTVDYMPGCFAVKSKVPLEDGADGEGGKAASFMNGMKKEGEGGNTESKDESDVAEIGADFWKSSAKSMQITPRIKFEVSFLMNRLTTGIGVGSRVLTPPSLAPNDILCNLTWEDVRQIYRRGAWIHCPSKPLILMQWAEFEEAQENIQTARELLNTVIVKHPKLLKARLQLIELERRSEEYDRVEELYAQAFSTFTEARIRSCIAIRYARFLFKIREDDEKALLILRKALKKDKGNIHLYHHVFDVCYQRRPIDINGVLASVMLALASKELCLEEKHSFCMKRSQFLREHGTMAQFKEAKAEMEEIKLRLDKERTLLELKKLEEERLLELKAEEEEAKAKKEVEESNAATVKNDSLAHETIATTIPTLKDGTEQSASVGASESREERSERRRRRDGSSEGHRHRKRSRKEHKSKKSRRSEGRRKRSREEGEVKDDEEEGEIGESYDTNEPLMYISKVDLTKEPHRTDVAASVLASTDQGQSQHGILKSEDKPYQAVPPTWNSDNSSLPNYGYGSSSEVAKETQNSLYERYYELVKLRYETKEQERSSQMVNSPSGNVILEANNSYLPPPPMPQGILGESLFNQGKLENLPSSANDNQGNLLLKAPPLLPPPTTGLSSMFASRLPPSQPPSNERVETPPGMTPKLLVPPPAPIGSRLPPPPLKPPLLQTKLPSVANRGFLDSSCKTVRPEQPTHLSDRSSPQEQMDFSQRGGLGPAGGTPTYPGGKPIQRGGRGGSARGRERTRPPSQQSSFNPQQSSISATRPPALLSLNISRDIKDSQIVNIPDWFLNEGGVLKLSDTANGVSTIRYWPRYLNEDGHKTLFQSLRETVRWVNFKQQAGPPSEANWVAPTKLVSWIGPCKYQTEGMVLDTNVSWPPEVVDLLHRLIHFSNSSFNSCFMSLYISGHSHHPWHSELHEAMSKNPTTACVSLGATRSIEMKKVGGLSYLRFPLLPGSLFVMEGATHKDWLCQIPKETHIKAERISLSFRTMFMIKGLTV